MMIRTFHIRQMLTDAIEACERAERPPEWMAVRERLLEGAAINARHAAAEIEDELFRLRYGEDGYTR